MVTLNPSVFIPNRYYFVLGNKMGHTLFQIPNRNNMIYRNHALIFRN